MIRRRTGSGTAFGARTATRLLAVAGLAFVTIIVSGFGFFAPVEDTLLRALSPMQAAAAGVGHPIGDFVAHFGRFGELQRDNERLRAENEKLSVQVARQREVEAAYGDLSKLLDIKSNRPDDRFLPASIVARSGGRYQRAFAINRGQSDGLVKGMVVLAPGGGVVGMIDSVLPNFAWVTLITGPTSKIPALVQDGRFDGILSGRADGGMRLEMLPQGSSVKPGEIVVTSGLGGDQPKGLPLGKVVDVGGSDQDLFPTVFVEPLASLRNLENVLVLTSFRPGGVPRYAGSAPEARTEPSSPSPIPTATATGRRAPESALPGGGR